MQQAEGSSLPPCPDLLFSPSQQHEDSSSSGSAGHMELGYLEDERVRVLARIDELKSRLMELEQQLQESKQEVQELWEILEYCLASKTSSGEDATETELLLTTDPDPDSGLDPHQKIITLSLCHTEVTQQISSRCLPLLQAEMERALLQGERQAELDQIGAETDIIAQLQHKLDELESAIQGEKDKVQSAAVTLKIQTCSEVMCRSDTGKREKRHTHTRCLWSASLTHVLLHESTFLRLPSILDL